MKCNGTNFWIVLVPSDVIQIVMFNYLTGEFTSFHFCLKLIVADYNVERFDLITLKMEPKIYLMEGVYVVAANFVLRQPMIN